MNHIPTGRFVNGGQIKGDPALLASQCLPLAVGVVAVSPCDAHRNEG